MCLFCCISSLIPQLLVAPIKSCLCQGASSSGEFSRASPHHPSQGITHGPFPQMSNMADKVRDIYCSINTPMPSSITNNTFFFDSFLCPCVILPASNSEALQNLEELNRNYQVGDAMILMIHANSSHTNSSSIPSASAA